MPSQRPSDRVLIARVLAGKASSFATLMRRYEAELLAHVQRQLRNRQQAEEVAAWVWESLAMPNSSQLKKFDPARADFLTYLKLLADSRIRQNRRNVQKRKHPEPGALPDSFEDAHAANPLADLLDAEFMERLQARLTPPELQFFRQERLHERGLLTHVDFLPAYQRKLAERILKKAMQLRKEDGGGVGGK
jgi:DNA-directed RNA polymerase specialized sigma24 family protein